MVSEGRVHVARGWKSHDQQRHVNVPSLQGPSLPTPPPVLLLADILILIQTSPSFISSMAAAEKQPRERLTRRGPDRD
jgi:hypothetical protein